MLKELNIQEVIEIKGGVSVDEYCDTLISMFNKENIEWWGEWQYQAWWDAYNTNCAK